MSRKKAVQEMAALFQRYRLTCDQAISYAKEAREQVGLRPPKRPDKQKKLPTRDEIRRFLQVVEQQNIEDKLMMKILLYMGIRVSELVKIRMDDIDFTPGQEKIYTTRKAGRNLYLAIPVQMTDILKLYHQNHRDQVYLFESRIGNHKALTTEAIRKKMRKYREQAGVGTHFHPHTFRHALLTYLAGKGWTPHELQQISGHASPDTLRHYVHMNPEITRQNLNREIAELEGGIG